MPKHCRRQATTIAAIGLLLLGHCFNTLAAGGTTYDIKHLTTEDGLPDDAVIAITQTRDGYLWLGTLEGLVRFDGRRFTVFNEDNTPGLSSKEIVSLFEDSRSNLWVGTLSAGVMLVKDGQVQNLPFSRGDYNTRLVAACEDGGGAVWLYAADGRLTRYRNGELGPAWNNFSGFPSTCRALTQEPSGQVWLGMDQGMFALGAAAPPNAAAPPMVQQEIMPDGIKLDFLLARRAGGLWRFAGGQIQKLTTNHLASRLVFYPWRADTRITAACEDKLGNLIVGTLGEGVFVIAPDAKVIRLSTREGLSSDSVLSLLVDREGILWVGTDGGGLNRVKRQVFETLEATRGKTVDSVAEDAGGGLWIGLNIIGAEANGVWFWKEGELQMFGRGAGLRNASVTSVFVDHTNRVWVSTRDGLFLRQDGQFLWKGLGIVAFAICQDRGGQIWFGTGQGLGRWDEQSASFLAAADGPTNEVRAITDDPAGNLWVGTAGGGLYQLRQGKFTAYRKTENGLPSDDITSLSVDRDDGALWIGTSGNGLARLQGGKWSHFGVREGLISDSIRYLLDDNRGYLWLGCNNGLMRASKQEMRAFVPGSANVIAAQAYGLRGGMPDSECTAGSQPAACRTQDGKLWFPTIKGLAILDPARLTFNSNPPPVVIESIRVDDQEQNTNGLRGKELAAVIIPAGREQLDIEFTSLSFADPERVRFRYQLAGFEKGWHDGRLARYPNLPHGEYTFHVTACNEDGIWNETGATLGITVLPPFWQQWWFRGLAAMSLLGVIVAVVHYVSTQRLQRQVAVLRQQQALEDERARIARDIHDQVGASLTQVSMLGEMVESDKDSPAEVETHARQITQAARETSRALDEIVWTVNPSNDTLDGLINYICKYAQDYLAVADVRYRLDVPPQLPAIPISPEMRHNVFLAAKEAVTNIVRHAHASEAWLRLRLDAGQFVLEIQDNGRGPAGLDSKAAQLRNGLRNMRKRMEDVGGEFFIGPAPEGGALVRLTVPLGKP